MTACLTCSQVEKMQHGLSVVADLTGGDAEMHRAVQEVIKAFGGLDIIVNRQVAASHHECCKPLCKRHACPVSQPKHCCQNVEKPTRAYV